MRTGALVRACFTSSKDVFASKVHFTPCSFFNMFVIFLRSSAKLGMNLLKKLIFPMKDCNSLIFRGWEICNIASILFGSIFIPSSEIMCPRSLPYWRPNSVFLRFKYIPNLLHFLKNFLKCSKCSSSIFENIVTSSR